MHWMFMPFRRYADFTGRSRRTEYWMFVLLNLIIWSIWCLISVWGGDGTWTRPDTKWLLIPHLGFAALYSLLSLIPGLAVTVRRLHDTDRSGWAILYGLIPIVGGLILLYFYVSEGTTGPNRFGEDPKAGER